MELRFLGTGGAWGLPEHTCPCATCRTMRAKGQTRTRTCLWFQTPQAGILIDPGPDLRAQLMREDLPKPDAVLISHEHGDHFLGLDELLCFRRAVPGEGWSPIPVYATADTWKFVEERFGYLIPHTLEKRVCVPGEPLQGPPFGPDLVCRPVKTDHGPFPKGSVGYVFDLTTTLGSLRVGYTGDLVRTEDPDAFSGIDHLVCQCAFLNEPAENRANHLSLQAAVPLLQHWKPGSVYFVHFTCQDIRPDDDIGNATIKQRAAKEPLCEPDGKMLPIPLDQESWQQTIEDVLGRAGLDCTAFAAFDGQWVELD